MKKLFSILLIISTLLIISCGSSSSSSDSSSIIGQWRINSVDGSNVSSYGYALTFTSNSYTRVTGCTETGSLAISGSSWSVTISSSSCGSPVGGTLTGTFSVSGDSATITCTSSNCAYSSASLTRISSGGNGTTTDSSSIVGQWGINTIDGSNVSSYGYSMTFTFASYTLSFGCSETGSLIYTLSAWSVTISSS
ncbi:MAG: hypothetical protein V3S46_04755, partial [Nitrospinota bacterium]